MILTHNLKQYIPFLMLAMIFVSCQDKEINSIFDKKKAPQYTKDQHSYARANEAVMEHLDLDINVDFDSKTIQGVAQYKIKSKGANKIIFDTKDLKISQVILEPKGSKLAFRLGKKDDTYGQALTIDLPKNISDKDRIAIHYITSPNSEALQWTAPIQTEDKKYPYLYTQGQAILTRSWIPIQDSPGIRITYDATVHVPKELLVVMSATNPQKNNGTGVYKLQMKQAIPPYLIAMAVGDLGFQSLGERTGVYAEKSLIKKVAYEFGDVEKMIKAAEKLYGSYRWDRYDIIVLPPSFPFGGMENPRLTFATPTVLAGDRSLTTLVAHELAHSWSGNLVTNATWEDFWLNEGFTVYFERRIMEAVYGDSYANMLGMIGRQDLTEELDNLKDSPDDTKLKLDLSGRNPDDGMTDIAYEKGFLLLKTIESKVGRKNMDAFLNTYFKTHAFTSITTEDFIQYIEKNLLKPQKVAFNLDEWIYQPGLPKDCVIIKSNKFEAVMKSIDQWEKGTLNAKDLCKMDWVIQQKIHFIRNIPTTLSLKKLKALDDACQFTNSSNSYISMVWFEQAIKHKYTGHNIEARIESFLGRIGRRWYITTIFRAYKNSGQIEKAKEIYKKVRPSYHAVSTRTLDEMLMGD